MTPSIDDIRRDDELLDALGGRKAPPRRDAATDALGQWVSEIDAPDRPAAAGRYARSRRGPARVGVLAAITVAALSISGVAAAVGGVPGISRVAEQMGFVHRSADFGSGAAGPTSTDDALPAAQSTATGPGSSTATSTSAVAAAAVAPGDVTRRVLPGAIVPSSGPHPGRSAAPKWTTSVSTGPTTSSTSGSSSSSSSSSGSSSSGSSGSSSSTTPTGPSGSSSTSSGTTRPTYPPPAPPSPPSSTSSSSSSSKPSSTSSHSPTASSSTTPPSLASTTTTTTPSGTSEQRATSSGSGSSGRSPSATSGGR